MQFPSGSRVNEIEKETEERRKYIVDNYKNLIQDIDDYVNKNKKGKIDLSFLNNSTREKLLNNKYSDLSKVIVDIRNNLAPTGPESNTINKTDNKFSNETKKMVKNLVAKGWSKSEIVYEMEKIYGSGIVTQDKLDDTSPKFQIIFFYAFNAAFYYGLYRAARFVVTVGRGKNFRIFKSK